MQNMFTINMQNVLLMGSMIMSVSLSKRESTALEIIRLDDVLGHEGRQRNRFAVLYLEFEVPVVKLDHEVKPADKIQTRVLKKARVEATGMIFPETGERMRNKMSH